MENMNRPTFEKTVDKLVTAYIKDELQHGDCQACVVGNLCDGSGMWKFLFMTDSDSQQQLPYHEFKNNKALIPILLRHHGVFDVNELIQMANEIVGGTGYSVNELARIEFAFETCSMGSSEDDYMFNGLMAVVDVLAEIHGIDLKQREEAKLLFVK